MKLVPALVMFSWILPACATDAADPGDVPDPADVVLPSVDGEYVKDSMPILGADDDDVAGAPGHVVGQAAAAPIMYHGGSIMTGTPKLYVIWYGNWTGNTALTIVPAFAQALGSTPYFNINNTYTDGSGGRVTGALGFGGQTTDAYSRGSALGDHDIALIVAAARSSQRLPRDPNGIYVVLTSADVNETSGQCTRYCGWHTYATIDTATVRLAYIGSPARCPSACEIQTATSPNGNPGADGLLSVLAHELDETITDPGLNAWYDAQGAENADKCAWTFGTTRTLANGSRANLRLGTNDYMIQQNWLNTGAGACAMAR